jgi:hypothetical protein
LPILGLVLVGVIASGLSDVFPRFLRFLLVFVVFSYLPGETFLRWAVRGRWLPAEVRLPVAAVSGLGASLVVTWLCWVLGVPFRSYIAVLQVAVGCVLAVFFWLPRVRRDGPRPASAGSVRGGHGAKTALLLFVACGVSVFFLLSPPTIDPRGDSLDHLGYIRNITMENRMEPGDVLAPAVFAHQGRLNSDPRKGAAHPLIAAISILARVDPLDVWRWLPVVLAPLAFLGFAAFASALLPSGGFVAPALVFFLMFQGGLARQFLGVIAYGQHLSLLFYWVLFVMSLEYLSARVGWMLVVIGVVCLGGTFAHVDVAIHAGLMYAGLFLFYRKFKFPLRAVLELGLVLVGGIVIAGAWKLATAWGNANVIHSHPQGLLYLGDIGARFFVPSPVEIIRRNGLVFFVGLFLIPFLPFIGRHEPDGRYARCAWMNIALALPPVLVAFNPFLAPLVYERGAYLLQRFVLNIPSLVITALVVGWITVWGRRGALWKKALAALVLIVWAGPLSVAADAWYRDMGAVRSDRVGGVSLDDIRSSLSGVICLINNGLPDGSVVMSDPVTSYVLSGFTRARFVTVLHQHGNPNDPYPIERLSAVHTVMSPYTSQTAMMYAVRKFGVEYIVVNGAFKTPYHDFLADWDPDFRTVLEQKIGSLGEVFREVYNTDRVTVYRVLGTNLRRTTWDPVIPFTQPKGHDLDPCAVENAPGTVRVAYLGIDPRIPLPGERVTATAVYRRGVGASPKLPLSLRLRFQDKKYFERAARFPGDKYVRRFLERRDGAFRRFRVDRTPFDGYFRPEEWPEEHSCYDDFEVQIPANVDETTYEIQWRLVEETLVPNFSIRDFLYNEDSDVGSPCTEIEIRRHVVR